MRRAMKGIVPNEILERKRKAYILHGPLVHLREARQVVEDMFTDSLAASLGLINQQQFLEAFRTELAGELRWLGAVTRTIGVELWLQSLKISNLNISASLIPQAAQNTLPLNHRAGKLRADKART